MMAGSSVELQHLTESEAVENAYGPTKLYIILLLLELL